MFISEPHAGRIYIAERSQRGSKRLLWSVMPVAPVAADVRIEPRAVPYRVRRRAYKLFWADRLREGEPTMIGLLFSILVGWLIYRWLVRSMSDVVITPTAPPTTVNVLIPSIVIHVHVKRTEHGRDVV